MSNAERYEVFSAGGIFLGGEMIAMHPARRDLRRIMLENRHVDINQHMASPLTMHCKP